jgi:hypothetical protein
VLIPWLYDREFEILLWPDMLNRLGRLPAGAVPGLASQESSGIWIRKA